MVVHIARYRAEAVCGHSANSFQRYFAIPRFPKQMSHARARQRVEGRRSFAVACKNMATAHTSQHRSDETVAAADLALTLKQDFR